MRILDHQKISIFFYTTSWKDIKQVLEKFAFFLVLLTPVWYLEDKKLFCHLELGH